MKISRKAIFSSAILCAFAFTGQAMAANPAARACLIQGIKDRHNTAEVEVTNVTLRCYGGMVGYKTSWRNKKTGFVSPPNHSERGWAQPDVNLRQMCGDPCK